jgi:hypothetical protein
MRILPFAALLGSGLWAQTPPSKPLEPAPAPQAAASDQTPGAAAPERKWELYRRFVDPFDTGRIVLPGVYSHIFEQVKVAPWQTCSIPLTDVAPKDGFTVDLKIRIPRSRPLAKFDLMPVAHGSPPCPPAKR